MLFVCSLPVVYAKMLFVFSLQDPAYDYGNGAYQEMKAEVTEVPASHLLPEGNHNFTGKVWGFTDADGAALIGQIP